VEQTGSNSFQNIIAIIPARLKSTRLEGKMLLPIAGKPLILHTYSRARAAQTVRRVIVATDSEAIFDAVTSDGGEALMTSPEHQSGSDRIAEVARQLPLDAIIVNVQGDEPAISPRTIDLAVEALIGDGEAGIATTCEAISEASDVLNPNVVKVVTDEAGYALYFSRYPIPYLREEIRSHDSLEAALSARPELVRCFKKHTGLYVYRRDVLLSFTGWKQGQLERLEMLEQLRAMENGIKIRVVETPETSIGVDTREDFDKVRIMFEG
jgi:3-deoxy-manno-octulosonate cytidylyltransferase (CMP-KDO synthetase)